MKLKDIFPKPLGIDPHIWYESYGIPYSCWEYMESLREDNPPKLQTVEGYRIAYQHDTNDHSWDIDGPIVTGLVFKGKRTCLGQGVWDVFTGEELVYKRSNKTTWSLRS